MTNLLCIVGLGNFLKKYEKTRHNVGKRVVEHFAKKEGWKFVKKIKLSGEVAEGDIEDRHVILFLPATYMNLSGEAVEKCMKAYSIDFSSLMVVFDDADLPFGQMLLKKKGGTGGHNGVASIRDCLHTLEFPRLRVGIGRDTTSLEVYVLENFAQKEELELKDVLLDEAYNGLKIWIQKGIQAAMNAVNVRKKNIKEKKENETKTKTL